jgi:hypothetical protein
MVSERDRERSVFAGLKSFKQLKPISANTKNGHMMWPFFYVWQGLAPAMAVRDVASVLAVALLAAPPPATIPGAGRLSVLRGQVGPRGTECLSHRLCVEWSRRGGF